MRECLRGQAQFGRYCKASNLAGALGRPGTTCVLPPAPGGHEPRRWRPRPVRASPGGGTPGCLGNPRSQVLRSARRGGAGGGRRCHSNGGACPAWAEVPGSAGRIPADRCAPAPPAGLREALLRRGSGAAAALWAELHCGGVPDPTLEGPQPHLTGRETETMMGSPGKDLLQGNAWCLGRTLLAQQGPFPSQLCSSGSCRCGPKGGLCGTVPLIWTLDPVATELLLLGEAPLPTLSSAVSSRCLPSCTIASLALSVGHFPFSFRSLSLNLRIPTLQSPVGMPPPCSLSAFTTGWNVPIRSSHLFRPQEPPVLVIKVGTMPLLGGKVKQRSQQAVWKLRTRLSGHRLPRLVGRHG